MKTLVFSIIAMVCEYIESTPLPILRNYNGTWYDKNRLSCRIALHSFSYTIWQSRSTIPFIPLPNSSDAEANDVWFQSSNF